MRNVWCCNKFVIYIYFFFLYIKVQVFLSVSGQQLDSRTLLDLIRCGSASETHWAFLRCRKGAPLFASSPCLTMAVVSPTAFREKCSSRASPAASRKPRFSRKVFCRSPSAALAVLALPKLAQREGTWRGSVERFCPRRGICTFYPDPLTRRNLSTSFKEKKRNRKTYGSLRGGSCCRRSARGNENKLQSERNWAEPAVTAQTQVRLFCCWTGNEINYFNPIKRLTLLLLGNTLHSFQQYGKL